MKKLLCKLFSHNFTVTTELGQNERMTWINTMFYCERCGHCFSMQDIKTCTLDIVAETETGIIATMPVVK